MSGVEGKLELERIVFIGRTFEEYLQMFKLKEADLVGRRILDCPAGACSFTAISSIINTSLGLPVSGFLGASPIKFCGLSFEGRPF